MKFTAYILAFIFSVLTLEPVFNSAQINAESECCTKTKCGEEDDNETEGTEDCENMVCNPFMSCIYGNFFLPAKQFVPFDFLPMSKQKIMVNNDNRIIQNLSECWHPPEARLHIS